MVDFASSVIDIVKNILKAIIRMPFQVWDYIPVPIKYAIYILLVLLMIVIIFLLIRYKDEFIKALY